MQVLVVGAGPVGLTAAHELARRGIQVRLVDRRSEPATTSRAIATHPRTLEIYEQMGVVDAMLARGNEIRAFTLHSEGRRLARLDADYSRMPTRFPFTLCIDQVLTEEVLRDAVGALGVKVEWDLGLETFTQDEDGVRATLRRADGGAEEVTADWLVGCDGGHSTVRASLGLPLIGESRETWLIADAQVETELPRNSIHWVRRGGRAMMMVPMSAAGKWRLLDTGDVGDGGTPDEVAERFTRDLSRGLGQQVRVEVPTWISVFTFQQRMIERMRVGRCFVAGDAAHVHSPASGQGLNTGIQDAYNLAWKLALVVRGQARDELLDSYSAERVPVGARLLESTKTATFLVALRNAFAGVALPIVFTVVRNVTAIRGRIQRKVLGGVSGLNLRYDDSPLTRRSGGSTTGPEPGQRATVVPGVAAVLREHTGWTLLYTGGDEVAPVDGVLATFRVGGDALPDPDGTTRAALGLGDGGWVLVRPDGYVCARGADPAEVGGMLDAVGVTVPAAAPATESR